METYAVTLQPQGSQVSPITSQTLFGAVCWAMQTLRVVDVGDLLADFSRSPRFAFSSTFPFIRGPNGMVRFFPKPASLAVQGIEELAVERSGMSTGRRFKREVKKISADVKQMKSVAYLSQGLFAEICAGTRDGLALIRDWGSEVEKIENALWLKQERQKVWSRVDTPDDLWRSADVQRNSVDRLMGATAEGLLFHENQTFYNRKSAGLWFVARADSEAWPWLEAAFRYLADTGLGGKRTVGKGHFDITWQQADNLLPDVSDADSFVTLSQYLPSFAGGRMEANPIAYTLQVVRQKAENKFPGQEQMRIYTGALHLFAEGSVFSLPEKRPTYGRIAKLSEMNGRNVYYNGLALPVFAKLGGAS